MKPLWRGRAGLRVRLCTGPLSAEMRRHEPSGLPLPHPVRRPGRVFAARGIEVSASILWTRSDPRRAGLLCLCCPHVWTRGETLRDLQNRPVFGFITALTRSPTHAREGLSLPDRVAALAQHNS